MNLREALFTKPAWWFAAACGVLMLVLLTEWLPAAGPPPPTFHSAAQRARLHGPQAADSDSDADKDTDSWSETITARPLFAVGRRPPKMAADHHTAGGSGLPRLSGIIITRISRRAIFMPDGGKPLVLTEGATLDDDTIRLIAADRVVVAGPKGDMTLYPSFDGNRTVPAPVVPGNGAFRGINPPGTFAPAFNGTQNPGSPQGAGDSDDNDSDDNTPPPPNLPHPMMPGGFRNPNFPRGRPQ